MKSFSFNGMLKKTPVLLILGFCFLYMGCPEPIPLHGSWADNRGDSFSFFDDDTFTARIDQGGGNVKSYEGSYTVLLNVITLNFSGGRIVTEWDIRGNMLYLNWTDEFGTVIALTLYKTSN